MKAGTLNRTTVKLVRKGTTSPVGATVRYNSTSRLVTLEPSAALARGATYNATVTRGAKDPSGNALAAVRTWSFTVRR